MAGTEIVKKNFDEILSEIEKFEDDLTGLEFSQNIRSGKSHKNQKLREKSVSARSIYIIGRFQGSVGGIEP